ncbi:MAG: helix-turn-helix domain-containing protein [Oligoflexia bacterium]|nr:helix-turn-helix domain-containing protein [Oligoflexia bacterium]
MHLQNGKEKKQGQYISSKIMAIERVMFETLISKKELVTAFGVSSSFISKLMAEEGLPYFKIGRAVRFRVTDISQWLDRRRIPWQ